MKSIFFALLIGTSIAVASNLESKLDALQIPDDKVSSMVSKDKLYIVNTRYSSLTNRHEVTLAGGRNFLSHPHLETQQLSATYRYHINSRFGLGLRHSWYENELSDSGKKLLDKEAIRPDSDFALKSSEIFGNINLFYGKLRVSSERVVYFDQYISLGYGEVELPSKTTPNYSVDIGVAFWIGKHLSARTGFRNDFYEQEKIAGSESTHALTGYIELGYLFGEGNRL